LWIHGEDLNPCQEVWIIFFYGIKFVDIDGYRTPAYHFILKCVAMQTGGFLLAFQRNVLPPN
jgi:hypothetical protein